MGLLSRATSIKNKAKGSLSRLQEAKRKKRESKRAATKDKYQRQIEREKEKLRQIENERRLINQKVQTASVKRKISDAKEKQIIDKINDVKEIKNRAKRIAGALTGSAPKKKRKRKR